MREQLLSAGLHEANGKPADVYVINTCTVTASADSDSRKFVRRALSLNPDAQIIVTGCYVEKDADAIKDICLDAVILKNNEKDNIASVIARSPEGATKQSPRSKEIASLPSVARNDVFFGISHFANHNRAFVKIQDGCDNYCSYCKVPMVRGRPRDRKKAGVVKEIKALVKNGFKEIVLCGICLGAYRDLTCLLAELEKIEGLERIRLSSIEPYYVDEKLIDTIASSKKICRHLHIPLQSGDNRILKLMNRRYTAPQYVKLINRIRVKMPDIAITTDVIVGFPGEAQEEFKNTLKALDAVKPMRTHVFSFSKRPGTKAFTMPGEPDKKEKSRRAGTVRRLAGEFASSYAKRFKGKAARVLVEGNRDKKTGLLTGYTDNYIKIFFDGPDALINEMADIRVERYGN